MSLPTSDDIYNTTAPYSYSEWSQRNSSVSFETGTRLYHEYIKQWYTNNNKTNSSNKETIKQDYVNLLRELTYFFSEEEKDLFLRDIDFNNNTEIIYAIPFFVQKLKEVALTLCKKREYVKSNRTKYESIGSSKTLETILYEYVLKSHTKSSATTQISISSLGTVFPDLTAVRDDFQIEIEEIYDSNTYADQDPSAAYSENITDIIPRIGKNPLFNIFAEFLLQEDATLLPLSGFQDYTPNFTNSNIYSNIAANAKYLGSNIYGLTATKAENNSIDNITINLYSGNNWFYWPSGEIFKDAHKIQNTYEPILLQASQFTLGESTAGTSYENSDLFFIESRGNIEGAWLRGAVTSSSVSSMVMTAQPKEIRSFIYPTPGYGLTNSFKYSTRILDDDHLITFNLLDPEIKTNIIQQYFSATPITETAEKVYINNTNLTYSKATAGSMSLLGDTLLVRPGGQYNDMIAVTSSGTYYDANATTTAFLYKLTSTELPISTSDNYIEWPLTSSTTSTYKTYLNITPDTCNDVSLGYININKSMIGAVAGENTDTADIIYKLATKKGGYLEAAWLQGGSVQDLASYNSYSIPVYNIPAVNCITPPRGAIQSNLSFKCGASTKTSFVWCDIDTPADEIFKYVPHANDCPYISTTHNYLHNDTITDWKKCTCKSVYYSPIGHTGATSTDNRGSADFLFADPAALGANFTLTNWRDTRNFNYKNSPQFAFYQKEDNLIDNITGWGAGRWKTGDGSKMILKTGRVYTYFRSSLRNVNVEAVPPMIGHYPYKKIISSVNSNITQDVVLLIDVSGSEYFSIEKTKALAQRLTNYINTQSGSQIGVVLFDDHTVVASYLTNNKQIITDTINLISVRDIRKNSNISAGVEIASKILTTRFGIRSENTSLVGLCSNLNVSIQTPFSQIRTTNIPIDKNQKTIILFSDGVETLNTGKLLNSIAAAKSNKIKIIAIDIGPNSSSNNYMERIASSTNNYFNYEKSLLQNDTEDQLDTFTSGVISNLYNNVSMQPVWRKAIVNGTNITPTDEISDMVFRPGDYLKYTHQTQVLYSTFSTQCAPFVINLPLYGWNYDTKSSDIYSLGAKPYWGKMYNYPGDNFTKFAREAGGHIRYFEEFIPISHPEISNILLNSNDYIEYRNNGCDTLVWKDEIKFTSTQTDKKWLKLKVCVQPGNLKELFTNISFDKIFEQTTEASDIILNTYQDYTPAYYCYFARNAFTAVQPLVKVGNTQTYTDVLTGIVIKASSPYNNLTNTHYASIASKPSLKNLTTLDSKGYYLLPTNLGTSYYLGRGYKNELDLSSLANYKGELLYLDPAKYTSNRGLTKTDQFSPYVTTEIDNTWIKESYNSEKKAGVILNAINYQKFVPYQSSYETYKHNIYGISRQDDQFEFWTGPNNNVWNDEVLYPSNYKKETYNLSERTKKLLVSDKTVTNWQTDLYGNNYSIYKNTANLTQTQIKSLPGELWVRDVNNNIKAGPEALNNIYESYISKTAHYNATRNNEIVQFDALNFNTIVIQTLYGISIDQISFNYELNQFSSTNYLPNFISLEDISTNHKCYYAGLWYDEHNKYVYINTFYVQQNLSEPIITFNIYRYDIVKDVFNILLTETIVSPRSISTINRSANFTYNKDTQTFNTTFIFNNTLGSNTFSLFSIDTKNLKNNPYVVNVHIAT